MKTIIKESLKKLIEDKYLLILSIIIVLLSIIFAAIISSSIHPSGDLKLVSHYSAYGVTHLYRDQWFYLYSFVAFDIIAAIMHIIISIKLLIVKGHTFAVSYAWLGICVMLIGLITALSVINVWTPL